MPNSSLAAFCGHRWDYEPTVPQILLIDEDDTNANATQLLLQKEWPECEFKSVRDVSDCHWQSCNAVLVAINDAGRNFIERCKKVHRYFPDVPIISVSADINDKQAKTIGDAVSRGLVANSFAKPIDSFNIKYIKRLMQGNKPDVRN